MREARPPSSAAQHIIVSLFVYFFLHLFILQAIYIVLQD